MQRPDIDAGDGPAGVAGRQKPAGDRASLVLDEGRKIPRKFSAFQRRPSDMPTWWLV
jgi:hypothetical protein